MDPWDIVALWSPPVLAGGVTGAAKINFSFTFLF